MEPIRISRRVFLQSLLVGGLLSRLVPSKPACGQAPSKARAVQRGVRQYVILGDGLGNAGFKKEEPAFFSMLGSSST